MIISVIGSHRIGVQPDRAIVFLTVSRQSCEGNPAAEVRARAETLAAELRGLVESGRALRHSVDPLRTSSWNHGDGQGLVRDASVRLNVTFADFAEVEALTNREWDELVSLDHVSWQLSDELRASKRDEVIALAIADAKSRARAMADAVGLGGLELVQLGDVDASSDVQQRAGGFAMKADLGVTPEDLQIGEQVLARFEAGPRFRPSAV